MRNIVPFTVALAIAACTPKHTAEVKVVEKDLSQCTGVDLSQTVVLEGEAMSLGIAVIGLIAQGPAGWAAEVASLAVKYGPKAVHCAAIIGKDLLHTPAPADGGVGPSTAAHEETAEDRADQVIQVTK